MTKSPFESLMKLLNWPMKNPFQSAESYNKELMEYRRAHEDGPSTKIIANNVFIINKRTGERLNPKDYDLVDAEDYEDELEEIREIEHEKRKRLVYEE